jgi:nitrile hydratase accessory protein
MTTQIVELDLDGPVAPPRSNGELVFAEPWEGRALGLAMALVHGEAISYETFRSALIERIGAWEAAPPVGEGFHYYRCWLQALEQVLAGAGLVSTDEARARGATFAARPAGHDHPHDGDAQHHGRDHG